MSRILIAVPVMEYIESPTFRSIYNLEIPNGVTCSFDAFRGYQLDDSRNHIARVAINDGYTHVFFVDADIILPPDALVRLLKANKEVVSGIYPCKRSDKKIYEVFVEQEFVVGRINPARLEPPDLYKVHSCGLGCTLIQTSLLRRIGFPQFNYTYSLDPSAVESEDIYFFNKVREVEGLPVWVDSRVRCGHIGKTIYPA